MGKKPYAEQLKDPKWQRKRLEVLNAANFTCECCKATEKTLHVHHKHYVKGRDVWDYEASELEALCMDCHEDAHQHKALIDKAIAQFPTVSWPVIAGVVVGLGKDYVDPALWLEVEDDLFARMGEVAWIAWNYSARDALEFRDCCMQLGPNRVLEVLRAAVQSDMAEGDPL